MPRRPEQGGPPGLRDEGLDGGDHTGGAEGEEGSVRVQVGRGTWDGGGDPDCLRLPGVSGGGGWWEVKFSEKDEVIGAIRAGRPT